MASMPQCQYCSGTMEAGQRGHLAADGGPEDGQAAQMGADPGDTCVPVLAGNRFCLQSFSGVFCMPLTSVHRVVHRMVEEVVAMLPQFVHSPRTQEMLQVVGDGFARLAHYHAFSQAAGAVDGCHIRIKCPGGPDGHDYNNRKLFPFVVLQAVCDHQGRFMDIFSALDQQQGKRQIHLTHCARKTSSSTAARHQDTYNERRPGPKLRAVLDTDTYVGVFLKPTDTNQHDKAKNELINSLCRCITARFSDVNSEFGDEEVNKQSSVIFDLFYCLLEWMWKILKTEYTAGFGRATEGKTGTAPDEGETCLSNSAEEATRDMVERGLSVTIYKPPESWADRPQNRIWCQSRSPGGGEQ
ncbi:hypothetical protein FQN60_004355 [Etheostoma spectabile]|uniref:DDE Tnp4 domain-containing protein n=1 Tax=Etheostoma spectabile TaxID=54343 RepID=A0A5J5D299_9PERO|nr:hypothetical protein FQN60_004355 [Etheostoma spectabile]